MEAATFTVQWHAQVTFASRPFSMLWKAPRLANCLVMRAVGRTNELPEFVFQTFVAKVIPFFGDPFLKAEVRFDDEFGHPCPPVRQCEMSEDLAGGSGNEPNPLRA